LPSQNSIPTLSLLHHRNIAPSPICTRCGDFEETILHCLRDTSFSLNIWQHLGFLESSFFSAVSVTDWIKDGLNCSRAILFAAGLWWVWRHRNSMCLSDETLPLIRLISQIHSAADDIKSCFYKLNTIAPSVRHIRWNNSNFDCAILNVDGSCIGSPSRTGFGGLIRNSAGFYLMGFSGSLPSSSDILEAELTAILHGLTIAKDMEFVELICYSDSLLSINLITGNPSKFHVHAVLIQEIKDKLAQLSCLLHHTLREGNYCADYLAKLGASSDASLSLHSSPPDDLRPLLRNDASGTLFLRS
jgi:ribonuclease HI